MIIAPAMDGHMYQHQATQENLAILKGRGTVIVGPAEGHLASGQTGPGRMVEPVELLGHIRLVFGKSGPLAGWRVLITAGGTEEPIDPVRTITNRSSGKQGYALAQAAIDLGAEVSLVSGPTNLVCPVGAQRIDVRTAEDMLGIVLQNQPHTDILVMAAAVADFKPIIPAEQKIKRNKGKLVINLETNPDILANVSRERTRLNNPEIVVGFAAETQDLLANAQAKLISKNLNLIVANDVQAKDAGFSVDTNRVTLLDDSGGVDHFPLMSKIEVAQKVFERVIATILARPLIHICQKKDWEQAREKGEYIAPSLNSEGFIHFSRPHQVLAIANQLYANLPELILLWINAQKLNAPLRWERVDDQLFPHLYGPLNIDAVIKVRDLVPDKDGFYRSLSPD